MRQLALGMFAGLMVLSLVTAPPLKAEDLPALASNESEQVTVDGNKVAIHQNLSDEARRAEKKRLKHAKKAGKKISKREAKAAGKIRKHERKKEKIAAKHAAKLERKKSKKQSSS